MAAPSSKPSPSNKDVQRTAEGDVSSLEASKVAASLPESATDSQAAAQTTKTKTNESTIADSSKPKESEADTKSQASPILVVPTYESSESSKQYVLAKKLLAAGEFEEALSSIEEGIEQFKAILASLNVEFDLHECMGPFHYLYGTTLLYSIEESNDTQMMTVSQGGDAGGGGGGGGDGGNSTQAQTATEAEAAPPNPDDNVVEDMEIAWENLEAARNILDHVLKQEMTQERKAKLQSDLAQTLLREGDLQRMNGRYSEAINDYESCLKLREVLLPPFDRKIADAQYNLGLSYLSNSTELQKDDDNNNNIGDNEARQKVCQEHYQKGIDLYLQCAKTICGQIAFRCGAEPEMVLTLDDPNKSAGFKTTGLEQDQIHNCQVSTSLSALRKNVAALTPTEAGDSTVNDLRLLLDEIQETVDEARSSQDAVRQAAELKNQAKKAAEKDTDVNGGTTTIGFDKPTLSSEDSKPASTGGTQPMMVVKKKKRKVSSEDGQKSGHVPDSKRHKTE